METRGGNITVRGRQGLELVDDSTLGYLLRVYVLLKGIPWKPRIEVFFIA